ncbi:MAG: hypothetical protein ACRDPY_15780 [Streptosporangiaceae bacterium]
MPGDAGRHPAARLPPGRQAGAGQLAGQFTVRGAGPGDHLAPGIVPAAVRGSAAPARTEHRAGTGVRARRAADRHVAPQYCRRRPPPARDGSGVPQCAHRPPPSSGRPR